MDKQQKRRELRLIQQESVWLQKALFALRKADATHEKLAGLRGEDDGDYTIGKFALSDLEDVLEEQVEEKLKRTREMRRSLNL